MCNGVSSVRAKVAGGSAQHQQAEDHSGGEDDGARRRAGNRGLASRDRLQPANMFGPLSQMAQPTIPLHPLLLQRRLVALLRPSAVARIAQSREQQPDQHHHKPAQASHDPVLDQFELGLDAGDILLGRLTAAPVR